MRLSAENLAVVYNAPGGGLLPALGPLSFGIESGTFVCVLGPSGCGKSTLVRVLAGLQRPSEGVVRLDGRPLEHPSRDIALMFQDANLMPWRTALDNIALPLELASVPARQRREQVEKLLPLLGLEDFARAYPGELSGGMAQRVALGRVLIQQPAVLLLDEPFGALDALTREQVGFDLLRIWARTRQTVVMVTHNIQEAVLMADRILVLGRRPGRITADIAVNLPRPRSMEHIYTEGFLQAARRTREAINGT